VLVEMQVSQSIGNTVVTYGVPKVLVYRVAVFGGAASSGLGTSL
jgi:hypothetical protein